MVRYSYNPEAQTCQSIDYNGCLGNENNFATPEECAKTCLPGNYIHPRKFINKFRDISLFFFNLSFLASTFITNLF